MTKRIITLALDEQDIDALEGALLQRAAYANELASEATTPANEQSYHAKAGRLNRIREDITKTFETGGGTVCRMNTDDLQVGDVITIDPERFYRKAGNAIVESKRGTDITVRSLDTNEVTEMTGFSIAWRVI